MKALDVDIAQLKPSKDNPRKSAGELEGLVASIKAIGILEPLVVTKNGAGYVVVAGSRRLAAAKKAGLKQVPVVVRELNDEERAEAMLIENLQRSDLTPLEEADAFAKLLELPGYSQRKIAERIGRNQSHVSRRLALRQLTPAGRKALDAASITVEDALELTKLEAHPDRMDKALSEGRRNIDWAVRNALSEIKVDAARAEATAKLQSAGTKIVRLESRGYYAQPAGATALVNTAGYSYSDRVKMKPSDHAKKPCHAAAINERHDDVEVLEICTDPKSHGKAFERGNSGGTNRGGPLTDKDKAARKAKRAHNAAIREAESARWEFLRHGFGARRLPATLRDRALELLVDTWANRESGVPYDKVGVSATALLGLEPRKKQYGGLDHRGAVVEHLKANAGELLRVALAVGIGAVEDGIRHDVGYHSPDAWKRAAPYFSWLEGLGYEISAAERAELAGKAPR